MSLSDECPRNKAVIRKLPKLIEAPDAAIVRELFTADFELHTTATADWPRGHDGALRMLTLMKSMIPDIRASIEDMFGEGDKVFVRWRFKGTMSGALEGRKGDGSKLETITFSVYRFHDSRIAEYWDADITLPQGHRWRTD